MWFYPKNEVMAFPKIEIIWGWVSDVHVYIKSDAVIWFSLTILSCVQLDISSRDKHSKRNSISTRVHILFSISRSLSRSKCFIWTQSLHNHEKQCDLTDFRINSRQLSPSKQIMQMLKLQPFIFPVVPHLFIAFVFPLSDIVGIGIHRL